MKRLLLVYGGILLFLAVAIGIVAAWHHLTREPSTVLTNPCDPPCWYGIQPGEMTSLRVLSILMELPWVSGIRERMRGFPARDELEHLEWKLSRPVPDAYGYAYFDDDLCTAVSILTYGSLTIADAFDRFGEPELMWMHTEKVGTREWIEVTLLWDSDGIVVEVDVDFPAQGVSNYVEILEKTPIWRVTYFDPSRFEDLLDTEILINETPRARVGEPVPWPGLGAIPWKRGQEQ
ncbi:MAG: hypothetical protein ACP5JJ_07910 [Anaerolineae bacterium]